MIERAFEYAKGTHIGAQAKARVGKYINKHVDVGIAAALSRG
jgi:hypothetical protein